MWEAKKIEIAINDQLILQPSKGEAPMKDESLINSDKAFIGTQMYH